MSTPLEAQRQRLLEETRDAHEQLALIRTQQPLNPPLLQYYENLVRRNTHLLEVISQHLDVDEPAKHHHPE